MIQEFYIREEAELESRGPYAREALGELIKKGEISLRTLYYDAETETWRPFGKDPELKKLFSGKAANAIILQRLVGFSLFIMGLAILLPCFLATPWHGSREIMEGFYDDPIRLLGAISICVAFPWFFLKKAFVWPLRALLVIAWGIMGILSCRGESNILITFAVVLTVLIVASCLKKGKIMISLLSVGAATAVIALILQII